MEFITERNRVVYVAEGKELAHVTFPGDGEVVEIDHTFVDDSLRGQGIAGKLMERAAQSLRDTNRRAKLTCSYAQKWFGDRPEWSDVLTCD
ncbi:MAG: N-acetyltransferase [Oscillospiraceae bacterium]|jgi:predicted GNAT family acetyltransferase|nr:N-acetyltransferase [Oscillospiraceae bacterium]